MKGFAKLTACLTACAAFIALAVAAVSPWRIPRATVAGAFTGELARHLGLRPAMAGRVTFKLLPRPRLQAADLSVSAEGGAVLLDAPLLKAELDIPSLLRGVWRMSSATLVEPTLTVDLDRLADRVAERSAERRTEVGVAAAPGSAAETAPGAAPSRGAPAMLRLRSALLKTRSSAGLADLLATDIDATAAWSGDGEGLVVAGTAALRGTRAQFTAALPHPSLSLTAAGSPASLQIGSPAFDFAADGVLTGGGQEQFAGRASFAAASLPRLLRMLGGASPPVSATRVQVSGDLIARPRDLSLSDAQVKLDGTRFEGTLAWRQEAGRGLVAGTLATDLLDVNALVAASAGPDRGPPDGGSAVDALFRRRLVAPPFATDVDLRVSAAAARVGRAALQDAAFAILVRGERMEFTLDEAAAYGGLVKARAVAAFGPGGIEAHADLSAKRIDLGRLSEGLAGRARVGGAMTARAALDGRGATPRDVVAALAGDGQIELDGGRIAGLSLADALRRLAPRSSAAPGRRGPTTVFDPARWPVSVRDGVVRVADGRLSAPGVALTFAAESRLPDGRVDLHAVAAQTDGAGAALPDGPSMPFDMRGFWTGPLTLVGAQAGLPPVAVPLVDGSAAGR